MKLISGISKDIFTNYGGDLRVITIISSPFLGVHSGVTAMGEYRDGFLLKVSTLKHTAGDGTSQIVTPPIRLCDPDGKPATLLLPGHAEYVRNGRHDP